MIILVTTIVIVASSSLSFTCCFGFQQSSITATSKRARSNNHSIHHPHEHRHRSSTLLCMVRNVDLPEAIVFYGIESIMEPSATTANNKECSMLQRLLRPGVKRLLEE